MANSRNVSIPVNTFMRKPLVTHTKGFHANKVVTLRTASGSAFRGKLMYNTLTKQHVLYGMDTIRNKPASLSFDAIEKYGWLRAI